MTELIYCADGNQRFAALALKHGFSYGAQLPNTVYYPPTFTDQNWRNPQLEPYIEAVAKHKPRLATVLDLERPEQLKDVLGWAARVAKSVESVIIIPKYSGAIADLPRRINSATVRLGYSVPTGFAGTEVPLWEFSGWPVHLLGGSPQKQLELARYLDVKSADGNYMQKMATRWNQYFVPGSAHYADNRFWPRLDESGIGHISNDAPYVAFELSLLNIKAAWHGCRAGIRYATSENDIKAVKKIANQYKSELGRVMWPALRTAVQKRELFVAEYGRRIVGFVNWHARRDGWNTIYEIAVDEHNRGENIGRALLESVPTPTRLKVTVDNPANEFYAKAGMIHTGSEDGRRRQLNVYEMPGERAQQIPLL